MAAPRLDPERNHLQREPLADQIADLDRQIQAHITSAFALVGRLQGLTAELVREARLAMAPTASAEVAVTVEEACRRLSGISKPTFYTHFVHTGLVPIRHIGRLSRVSVADLEAAMAAVEIEGRSTERRGVVRPIRRMR